MSHYDIIALAIGVLGLGATIALSLVSEETRRSHPKKVGFGLWSGLVVVGVGIYMAAVGVMPIAWGLTVAPKISIAVGAVLLVGGIIWKIAAGEAQVTKPSDKPLASPLPPLVGTEIEGNHQGGPAADVNVTGSRDQKAPPVGMDTQVHALPGQSATGMRIIQNGPGTGLKITVGGDGPATGVRVGVTSGNAPAVSPVAPPSFTNNRSSNDKSDK